MDLVQVDVVGPQSLQARFASFGDNVRILVCSAEFGRDYGIAAPSRECTTENFLRVGIVRISLCGVEKVDTSIERGIHRGN